MEFTENILRYPQLINSFLGLIVFVKEFGRKQTKILEEFVINNFPTDWNYIYEKQQEEHNFKNYLRHIRNAIAHPKDKIETQIDKNKEIISIKFKDFDKKNENNKFETTLSLEQIDQLIDLLTDAFFGNDKCLPNGKI